jgi:hypothetical protein
MLFFCLIFGLYDFVQSAAGATPAHLSALAIFATSHLSLVDLVQGTLAFVLGGGVMKLGTRVVRALPTPQEGTSARYRFWFLFLNKLCENPDRVEDAK